MSLEIAGHGRVKASIVDMSLIVVPSEPTYDTYQMFAQLRSGFAENIRDIAPLFPEGRDHHMVERSAKGPAFTRGAKDDQGPFGTHAPFRYAGGSTPQRSIILGSPEPLFIPDAGSSVQDRVGSRTGFLAVNPARASNAELSLRVEKVIDQGLGRVTALAAHTDDLVRSGMPFCLAVQQTRAMKPDQLYKDTYGVQQPLYTQTDVRLQLGESPDIFQLNVPDVGLFYSMLDTQDNQSATEVKTTVQSVINELTPAFAMQLAGVKKVRIVTRDSVVQGADVLERLEATALTRILNGMGIDDVKLIGQSDVNGITQQDTLILLNTDTSDHSYGIFAEHVIRGNIRCYPNPAVQAHAEQGTTYATAILSGKRFDELYNLLNPNRTITPENCERIHRDILSRLDKGGITSELFYVYIPGQTSPLACTRSDLRSIVEIRKQIDKQRKINKDRGVDIPVESVLFMDVPYTAERSIVRGPTGLGRVASLRVVAYERPT